MIGSLRGLVLERVVGGGANGQGTAEVLLEVGGVGYRVTVTAGTLASLGALGSAAFVHVHTHVREDAITLYGFATLEERVTFEALIGAHGVGVGLALAILSVHSPSALRRAIATDDVAALTLVPGVGKKTATRLLLELKARLDLPEADLDAVVATNGAGGGAPSAVADVRAALAGLGYDPEAVREVVRTLPEEGPVEDLLRFALRQLAAR